MATINYHDVDFFGENNPSGSPKEYYGEEAIKRAFNNYLISDPDDFLYQPYIGGLINKLFHKNMNGVDLQNTAMVMRNTIQDDFGGITLDAINFNPDYQAGVLQVEIIYTINATGNRVVSAVNILTDVSDNDNRKYTEIEYVAENLLTFCEQKKPQIPNEILGFDANLATFRWGEYLFINFDQNDPLFDEILLFCNS